MEEELVSGSDFQNGGGGKSQVPTAPKSYTEVFWLHLPFYLAIGMTQDEFWNGDVFLAKSYREAHEMKKTMENEMLWLEGAYFYNALCSASPLLRATFGKGEIKSLPYLDKPFPITKIQAKENKRREEEKKIADAKNAFRQMAAAFNASFQKKANKEVTSNG